jgi:hypothetical protein
LTELPPRRRRERPPVFEWTVFAVAGFLALFIVYEVAKRRVKPAAPPAAASAILAPAAPSAPPAAPPSVSDPPERPLPLKGHSYPVKTERRLLKQPSDVPAPR